MLWCPNLSWRKSTGMADGSTLNMRIGDAGASGRPKYVATVCIMCMVLLDKAVPRKSRRCWAVNAQVAVVLSGAGRHFCPSSKARNVGSASRVAKTTMGMEAALRCITTSSYSNGS
ncbi:unnamed protein product [Bursaphelenchus okinawaensis]|uniref:Uncharacterized protein n=1 Tax=Bursaphelenchus okinawaensis TaxID=465554 RepID=A0A811KB93_9BILA|nr:unnamed protein product [Bursaphelenchus okinawaensis]CAG9097015.1 unnamed protein product [Bursaphelenchus okinawaensis]